MFWFWIYVVLHIAMILINTVWCVVVFRLTSSLIWRTVIVSFMVAQVIALVMLQTPIGWVAYGPKTFLVSVIVWNNLALFCGFVAALGYGLVRGIRFLGGRWPRSSGHTDAPTQVPAPQEDTVRRREFIGACAALMPVALTTGWTALAMKQISGFRVRRMTLSIPTLPRALDGLTIAHVSDM